MIVDKTTGELTALAPMAEPVLRWIHRRRNLDRVLLTAITILYLSFALGSSLAKRPRQDEGVFASPSYNLLTKGYMGTSVVETQGSALRGLERYTYWVMPLHLVTQAGWYKLFGFSLLSMRGLSVAWGLVALASWFLILRRTTGSRGLALLGVALIAGSYDFVMIASDGRMDAMCASLCFAGFAAYLELRQRSFWRAVLVGNSLVAAALFTHPNGLLGILGLAFLIWYFDQARFQLRYVGLAAAPYLVCAAGWGVYILQDPNLFLSQFSANAQDMGRLSMLFSPWAGLKAEMGERYLGHFSGFSPHAPKLMRAKVLIVLVYAVALIGSLWVRAIRQHSGRRALLQLTGIYFLALTLLDGQKQYVYVIHLVPFYAAVTAVWIHWWWSKKPGSRRVIALGIAGFLLLQSAGIAYRIVQDTYHRAYAPAVQFLDSHSRQGTLVMGSAELGFGVGFDHLMDDPQLGYLTNKKPDFIVVTPRYESYFRVFRRRPELYQFVSNRLATQYQLVYDHTQYKIYAAR